MKRVAINGFGRIGRLFFRQAFASGGEQDFEIVAINDLGELENLAYLLKYDSVYGKCRNEISVSEENGKNYLVVDGKRTLAIQEKDPLKLPWKELAVDIVVESTGVFESFEKAKAHLDAGAKRVIISAPAKDAEGTMGGKTILMGINDSEIETTVLASNASCTTNAAAPVIEILRESIGVEKALLNTVHAYTATQSIVDGPVKGSDFRRGRAGAQNLVPSTTGAAIAVTRVIKELEGKFDGVAIRVPVITGSLIDITFIAKRNTTTEEIAGLFKKAASDPRWQGIVMTTEEQLVSSDIVGEPCAVVVDTKFTKVVDGNLVKVLAWYDNEWGYVKMLLNHVEKAVKF